MPTSAKCRQMWGTEVFSAPVSAGAFYLLESQQQQTQRRFAPLCAGGAPALQSDFGLLFFVAAEIPAGSVAQVRKEGIYARLWLGWIYVKLGFAVFLFYRVGGLDLYRSQGLAGGGNSEANG